MLLIGVCAFGIAGVYAQTEFDGTNYDVPEPTSTVIIHPDDIYHKFDPGFYEKIQNLTQQTARSTYGESGDATREEIQYYDVIIAVPHDSPDAGDEQDPARQNKDVLVEKLEGIGARIIYDARILSFVAASVPVTSMDRLAQFDEVYSIGDGEIPITPLTDRAKEVTHSTASDILGSAGRSLDGSGVTVLVLEGEAAQSELIANLESFLCDAGIGCVPVTDATFDRNNHATQVSLIVASSAETNGGIAPGVNLLSISNRAEGFASSAGVFPGIDLALQMGADVFNASFTSLGVSCANLRTTDVIYNEAATRGLVVVAGAGNFGQFNNIGSPACLANAIAVGSVDPKNNAVILTSSSDKGPGRGTMMLKPEILAPGSVILTADTGIPIRIGGTSFATPIVVGASALLLEFNPELTPSQTKIGLLLGADYMGPVPCTSAQYETANDTDDCSYARQPARGDVDRDSFRILNNAGFGILNVSGALQHVDPTSSHVISDFLDADISSKQYSFEVTDTSRPVKVILSWLVGHGLEFDPFPPLSGVRTFMADLDFMVEAPNGDVFYANSTRQINEFVIFDPPVTGRYNVTVTSDATLSDPAEYFALGSTQEFTIFPSSIDPSERPTATISVGDLHDDSRTNSAVLEYTVEFDENVSGFDEGDIDIGGSANGGSPQITGFETVTEGREYSFDVLYSSDGTVQVTIARDAALDDDGNGNRPVRYTLIFDTEAPRVSFFTDNVLRGPGVRGDIVNAQNLFFILSFSETMRTISEPYFTVSGTANDGDPTITVIRTGLGGSISTHVDRGSSDGTVMLTLHNNTLTDLAGNAFIAPSEPHIAIFDTTPPAFTVGGNSGDFETAVELGDEYAALAISDIDDATTTVEETDTGGVDVSGLGTFAVTYTVTDASVPPNSHSITETVTIQDTTRPVIAINEDDPFITSINLPFTDPGAEVTDNDPDYTGMVTASGNVDTNTAGEYTVTYSAPADASGNTPDPVMRTVRVIDSASFAVTITSDVPDGNSTSISPVPFTVLFEDVPDAFVAGDIEATNAVVSEPEVNPSNSLEYTFTATPSADGTVTVSIPRENVDSGLQNNAASGTYSVFYDTMTPQITITGQNPLQVNIGGVFTDPGAEVTDNDPSYDGTVTATHDVDVDTEGDYTITYSAPADAAGNAAVDATRQVQISDLAAPELLTVRATSPNIIVLEFSEPVSGNLDSSVTAEVNFAGPPIQHPATNPVYLTLDVSANPLTLPGLATDNILPVSVSIDDTLTDLAGNPITPVSRQITLAFEVPVQLDDTSSNLPVTENEAQISEILISQGINGTLDYEPVAQTINGITNVTTNLPITATLERGTNDVVLNLAGSTMIEGAQDEFDGTFGLPASRQTCAPTFNSRETVQSCIEIGITNGTLSLDRPASISLQGEQGNTAYFGAEQGQIRTEITARCDGATDAAIGGTPIGQDGQCFFRDADSMIILTRHFTTFGTFSTAPDTNPAPSSSSVSRGGGGGGGGGRTNVDTGQSIIRDDTSRDSGTTEFPHILAPHLTVYDLCGDTGNVRVVASSVYSGRQMDITIQAGSSVITAKDVTSDEDISRYVAEPGGRTFGIFDAVGVPSHDTISVSVSIEGLSVSAGQDIDATPCSGYDVSPHDFVKIIPPAEPYFIPGIIEPACGPGTHSVGGICQAIPEPAPIRDDPVPEVIVEIPEPVEEAPKPAETEPAEAESLPADAPVQVDPEPVIDPKPEIVCGSGTHSVDGTCVPVEESSDWFAGLLRWLGLA